MEEKSIPRAFIWKRLHSLTGVCLVLFLIEHLLVNSQAAFFLGDSGGGFVRAVNKIKDLPFLPVLEVTLLGIPFLVHMILGVRYLFTGESNSFSSNGATPSLPEYTRNQAYTFQRVTSWLLLFGITAHVIHMRVVEYPASFKVLTSSGEERYYLLTVTQDEGLQKFAKRFGVELLDEASLEKEKSEVILPSKNTFFHDMFNSLHQLLSKEEALKMGGEVVDERHGVLQHSFLKDGEVLAITPNFGTAELLLVRETFKGLWMVILYSLLVLAASFHAFNGLWTASIKWGLTLTDRSQKMFLKVTWALMVLVFSLGMMAIFGSYFLRY